jgi:hypothetical protein
MDSTMNTRLLRIVGSTVFFLGVIIGVALAVMTIWSRMEATNYYYEGAQYAPFNGLRCPLMIAPTERGIITAAFNNPTEREDIFFYRAEISGSVSTRQVEGQAEVPPRQTKTIQFTVDANDVDLMFFILVKINILPNAGHRAQESVCGVIVTDFLGLTGAQIPTIAFLLSFLGMVVGLSLWNRTSTGVDRNRWRAMQVLGLMVVLTMLTGLMGWWFPATALLAITILLIVISLFLATN